MPLSTKRTYCTSISLENVCSFAQRQVLNIKTASGAPARWTLILGENGVGKTKLLQCLANMRPIRNARALDSSASNSVEVADAALYNEDSNDVIAALVRNGGPLTLNLTASFAVGSSLEHKPSPSTREILTALKVTKGQSEIDGIDFEATKLAEQDLLGFNGAFVIGYGAARHMGISNSDVVEAQESVASLFDATVELYDAEEILYQLDYSRLKRVSGASARLKAVQNALVAILPDVQSASDILIYGPRGLGIGTRKTGIHVRTPYGEVPFASLSLGYQTISAWTIDLAWRLIRQYPESSQPLAEPAIVLIDEIDLHLHPRWQRDLRQHLTTHFPNVQFIATAHSPLMAQNYLDANLAVILRNDDHAVIENNPAVVKDWRLDQIITSELFGLKSSRPLEIEQMMTRKLELVRKERPTALERKELHQIELEIRKLSTAEFPEDQNAMEIIRKAAEILKNHKPV